MVPRPTSKDYKGREYWKQILPELRRAYKEVCAYSSLWIPNWGTVDHFYPKTTHPQQAYEWSNYRLASARINNNKGNSLDVLDPFSIRPGWFILDVATLFVQPESTLGQQVRNRVQRTIDILKLNDEIFTTYRFEVLRNFMNGDWSLNYIAAKFPFIASEIQRQGIQPNLPLPPAAPGPPANS